MKFSEKQPQRCREKNKSSSRNRCLFFADSNSSRRRWRWLSSTRSWPLASSGASTCRPVAQLTPSGLWLSKTVSEKYEMWAEIVLPTSQQKKAAPWHCFALAYQHNRHQFRAWLIRAREGSLGSLTSLMRRQFLRFGSHSSAAVPLRSPLLPAICSPVFPSNPRHENFQKKGG